MLWLCVVCILFAFLYFEFPIEKVKFLEYKSLMIRWPIYVSSNPCYTVSHWSNVQTDLPDLLLYRRIYPRNCVQRVQCTHGYIWSVAVQAYKPSKLCTTCTMYTWIYLICCCTGVLTLGTVYNVYNVHMDLPDLLLYRHKFPRNCVQLFV